MTRRLRILVKLFHAIWLHPEQRIGQVLANAIESHSASNARNDLYYVDDDLLLHVLREYNKEAL